MTHRIVCCALGFGLLIALWSGCAINPITGDEELMFFSPEDDVALGRKYAPSVEKELGGRIPDENIQSYVSQVGQRIARVCHRPDLSYHFVAVEEGGANALAMPGGYVYITKGLLKELTSEAELAAILGHEVGHVVARDTMETMSRQIGMTALVAAAHVGSASSEVARASVFITGFLSLQYSRDDEKQADLTGLSYMVQAGYDPNGMVDTMRVLQHLQTVRPLEFFSTHPNPENRLVYIQEKIASRYADAGTLKKGDEDYAGRVLKPLKERANATKIRTAETSRTEAASPSAN
jgi:predicted Zn-dependent protease